MWVRKLLLGVAIPVLVLGKVATALAHGGEDHGHDEPEAAAVADTSAPSRLADGSVFVPKASQRQLGIRTIAAEIGDHAAVIEFNGKVVADPGAGGKVQSTQAGRIEAGPRGFAVLGQRVRRGEVLAYLQPVASSLERSGQFAQIAELDAQHEVAVRRLARLEQLEGVVPAREIEAARVEAGGLAARKAALAKGLSGREPLVAPVSGVVASTHVTLGEVVEARDTLFEVVDPRRLAVEALAYDAATAAGLGEATAALPDGVLHLNYLGSGAALREGALPVLFRVRADKDAPAVAVGQSLKVLAQTAAKRPGVALPAEALTRNGAGEPVVWVHVTAERFVPRKVTTAPVDAATVAVTAGLAAGERVVVKGAASLALVR
ncbi:efflux RND transporter periplasmic adaptor subunit [Azoarcus sp. KH32C]|uniref:efflux RND transporter periplasmic adaptor subunit n=1 Tax=Azoarcus sp. KH32C TaxID=748247 RepID=UPI0002386097|nr:HlyD family efflux transporter periplasmic adaptor subunit [Azoarcus sp. KH32C]BAL26749.1 efflux transporter, RND family, MFP subunit [Azoarcus sp. KH32C]